MSDAQQNDPGLWRHLISAKKPDQHKYDHGSVLIYGGSRLTGAARLAGLAALRAGAGVCTIAAAPEAVGIYAASSPLFIVEPCERPESLAFALRDHRRNAILIGPGAGLEQASGLRQAIEDLCRIRPERACVLDADALTSFADNRTALYDALGPHCVITPHEGEFQRIFPQLEGSRLDRALAAAKLTGAVVLLKGYETIIADAQGRAVINRNAPPDLATAGAGDVLAGIIVGLRARGVPAFEAACAGAWIQGAAASAFGAGLVATDIIDNIPAAL